MKIIKIPCAHWSYFQTRTTLVEYLLTLGLVKTADYELYYFTATREIHITLYVGNESNASLILMKFI